VCSANRVAADEISTKGIQMTVQYRYNSLEDFLATNTLSVDAQVEDGWGAFFPVKGREINATILF
jgi:hypothetical protein